MDDEEQGHKPPNDVAAKRQARKIIHLEQGKW
jgi:hypothetical protein